MKLESARPPIIPAAAFARQDLLVGPRLSPSGTRLLAAKFAQGKQSLNWLERLEAFLGKYNPAD